MPNLIELANAYVPMLDEVYRLASCTSDLDGAPELARQGANANELIIPMLEMDGLADYDRNGGYPVVQRKGVSGGGYAPPGRHDEQPAARHSRRGSVRYVRHQCRRRIQQDLCTEYLQP